MHVQEEYYTMPTFKLLWIVMHVLNCMFQIFTEKVILYLPAYMGLNS